MPETKGFRVFSPEDKKEGLPLFEWRVTGFFKFSEEEEMILFMDNLVTAFSDYTDPIFVETFEQEAERIAKEGQSQPPAPEAVIPDVAVIDLETTGTNPDADRIVQISVITASVTSGLIVEKKTRLLDPERAIPGEATAIHGITSGDVAGKPVFKSIARSLYEQLKFMPIVAYNGIAFDIPLLSAEFARAGFTWPTPDNIFIDPLAIWRTKEPRHLADGLKYFAKKTLNGAHNAEHDAEAAFQILVGQFRKYPELSGMSLEDLHKLSMGNRVDFAGKIVLDAEGAPIYSFGPSKGKRLIDEPGFGEWMLSKDFPENTKLVVRRILGIV